MRGWMTGGHRCIAKCGCVSTPQAPCAGSRRGVGRSRSKCCRDAAPSERGPAGPAGNVGPPRSVACEQLTSPSYRAAVERLARARFSRRALDVEREELVWSAAEGLGDDVSSRGLRRNVLDFVRVDRARGHAGVSREPLTAEARCASGGLKRADPPSNVRSYSGSHAWTVAAEQGPRTGTARFEHLRVNVARRRNREPWWHDYRDDGMLAGLPFTFMQREHLVALGVASRPTTTTW